MKNVAFLYNEKGQIVGLSVPQDRAKITYQDPQSGEFKTIALSFVAGTCLGFINRSLMAAAREQGYTGSTFNVEIYRAKL